MRCTWVDCELDACIPQIARDGTQWANLCAEHALKLDTAIAMNKPKILLAYWVKAQGGSKKAAERM